MIGLVVLTYYNDRTYKIIDVAADKFIDSILTKKDGTKISYRDYFQQVYLIIRYVKYTRLTIFFLFLEISNRIPLQCSSTIIGY